MDATGLSINRYATRWSATPINQRRDGWLKVHGIIDVDSLAFLAWKFTDPGVHDTLVLPSLLSQLGVVVCEVYADAGYLSSRNVQEIVAHGGTPFVRPKRTTRGRPRLGQRESGSNRTSEAFRGMVDAYRAEPARWLKRYGTRNTIESAWSGVKRRFTGVVNALSDRMRRVEAALKLVVWNLTRVTRKRWF